MARMPGAIWKPLAGDWASQPRMRAFDIIAIHTMVGGLDGTDNLFRVTNGPGFVGTESHFGTSHDGRIVQWQDTARQAEANYNGNHHIISIENADWGAPFPKWSGSDVPAFTAAQIEANAQIVAWACRAHGIPCVLIPDSKPGRRGIAPHRWGVPGYMVPGGEQWSTSQGKACPGNRRIAQLPQIIARAQQLLGGAPTQEDDMPLTQADADLVAKAVHGQPYYYRFRDDASPSGYGGVDGQPFAQFVVDAFTQILWGHGGNLAWGPGLAVQIPALRAEVAALRAGESIDVDEVTTRITEGVSAKLMGSIGAVVREVLGEDNAEQADAIVDKLAARLGKAA